MNNQPETTTAGAEEPDSKKLDDQTGQPKRTIESIAASMTKWLAGIAHSNQKTNRLPNGENDWDASLEAWDRTH